MITINGVAIMGGVDVKRKPTTEAAQGSTRRQRLEARHQYHQERHQYHQERRDARRGELE